MADLSFVYLVGDDYSEEISLIEGLMNGSISE